MELEEEIFIEYLNTIQEILDKEEIKKLKELQAKSKDINEQVEIANKILSIKKRSEKNGRN